MADAEVAVASRKAQIGIIEQEILDLENELNLYNQLLKKHSTEKQSIRQGEATGDSLDSGYEENVKIQSREPVKALHKESEPSLRVDGLKYNGSSLYTIKLVSFVNARHFVSFGQNPGPMHAHSWQIQIEVRVPAKNPDLVAFARVLSYIKEVLSPFEDVILNYVHPFNIVQPTTENIALYFFNRMEDAISQIDLGLGKISVWETPTKGIQVDCRYPEIDALIEGDAGEGEYASPQAEVAVAVDDSAEWEELKGSGDEAGGAGAPGQATSGDRAPKRRYHLWQYALSIVIISLAAVIVYHNILFPQAERHYPWGSDTWGHLFKAEYLYNELLEGNLYPQFTEYWYNGSQPFRYWAPLPYYTLALLRAFIGDIFYAGNYFLVICVVLGGITWLLLAGRMGLWPATMAGTLWLVWPDNVRVAFLEGNLPRVLATAMLPLLFVLFLNVVENRRGMGSFILTVILIHLVVICHAMIAAVYCLCLVMFAFFLWVFRGCGLNGCLRGIFSLVGGIATTAWWLLPSITGGITDIDAEAVKNFIQFVPAAVSFNPVYRFENHLTFYWGISILPAVAVALYSFRLKPPWAKSLVVCGIVLILITFPVLRILYITMPLSHLLWPLRFSSFAALAVLASCLSFSPPDGRGRLLKSSYAVGMLIAGIFSVFLIDSILSVRLLVYTNPKSPSIMMSTEVLKAQSGWRVATIDLGRLDSVPSFLFSDVAKREQIFGWAWQGAVTSKNIMLLNTGMEMQYYPFLFRSCVQLGATDLIVFDKEVEDPAAFQDAALKAGYRWERSFSGISIWRGLDRPYILEKKNKCLVAGKYAGVLALQFPEAEMGFSRYIDDYRLEYLKEYPLVVFTGAEWRSKTKAEELVTKYAAAGGKIFIDIAGMPQSVLSKQPQFLGVYGETVMPSGPLNIFGHGRNILLQPFSREVPVWKTYIPLLLDEVELEFSYFGNQAPVYGYKLVGGNKISFLGGNILYHSFLTGDQAALGLMRGILGLRTDYTVGKTVQLEYYRANQRGYVLGYHLDSDMEAIIPIAAMDGIRVELDGKSMPTAKFENLLQLDLPPGSHEIVIYLEDMPVYRWGSILSAISLIVVLVALFIYHRKTVKN